MTVVFFLQLPWSRLAQAFKTTGLISVVIAALIVGSSAVNAQNPAPKAGAAEQAGKGWPYPEPAQRGATGYSPDYAVYTNANERWDIYVHVLWRKTASRSKADLDYYDYEMAQFLDSVPLDQRAKFKAATQLLLVMEQIRGNSIKLPYRDNSTGCLLFSVKHDNRTDLAAGDCARK